MAENDPTKPAEGAPTDPKKPDEQPQKFMTAEEFNKAATAREKRLLNQIQEMFKAAQAPKKPTDDEPVDETTDDTTDDEIVDETVEEDPKPAKKPAAKPGLTKAEIAAKKANEKAERALREAKAEREKAAKEKADAAAREEKLATQSALVQAQAVNQKQALAVLKAENRIKRDENGELVFVMPRDIAGEKFEEELPLVDGIREWLASDDGKLYAPPKNVEGSGAGNQGKPKSLKDMSKGDRKKAAGATLLKWAMNR